MAISPTRTPAWRLAPANQARAQQSRVSAAGSPVRQAGVSAADTPRRGRRADRALLSRIGTALATRDAGAGRAGRAVARVGGLERQGVRGLKRGLRELEREVRKTQGRVARPSVTLKGGARDAARRATR